MLDLNEPTHAPAPPITSPVADPGLPFYRESPVRRRVIVVGLGSIGRRHARLLAVRPDLHVELCETGAEARARARAEFPGLPLHRELESALRSKPEAVVIATPHELHASQAVAAMEAGADVLAEKPLCLDGAEAGAVIAATRRTGRKLTVGFQLHFHPGLRRLRRLIRDGTIGEVVHLHVRTGSYITLRNSVSRYQQSLRGALLLDYAHQPDAITWLLDALPAGVALDGLQAAGMPLTSVPNVMAMTLDFARPLLATVHLNYVQMPQRHEWEVVGDQGWIVLDADRGTLRLGRRETETETQETVATDRDETYRLEHQAFVDYLDGLRPAESPAASAARSVELFAMAMRSFDEGRRIACEWRDFGPVAQALCDGASHPA
jgi:predicted dehydrogenase